MHLDQLHVLNFRSCRDLCVYFDKENPNIFIGLNDSGKTSILNAANLLLGEKVKFNHIVDGNNKNDISNNKMEADEVVAKLNKLGLPTIENLDHACIILGKLVYLEEEAKKYPDANLSTPLMWSLESNEDFELWVVKVFSPDNNRFLILQLDSDKSHKLWDQTQKVIDQEIKELGVSPEDIKNENGKGRFSSFEKIRAVYAKYKTELVWSDYKFAKGDKEIFPSFSLYDWNSSLEDVLNTASDIMEKEIKVFLDPVKKTAQEEAVKAEKAINKKFGELKDVIKTVAKDVEAISSKVFFNVKQEISDVMVRKAHSDGDIHLENQGEGLKRQIWFSLIKAKASDDSKGANQFIWAFDEPETHLYPAAQREFFDIIKTISMGNVQTLISTHSTVFIDKSKLDQIGSASQNTDGYTEIDSCQDVDSIYESLNVRNSDFLFYDKFLVVEGSTEENLIPKLYKLYCGRTLIDDNIQLIKAKGKSKWTQTKDMIERLLSGFRKSDESIIYLFDKDAEFQIGENAKTDKMHFVGKQDIEDSFNNEVWERILNKYYEGHTEFTLDWIEERKQQIEEGADCPENRKMIRVLKSEIREKWVSEGHEEGTEKLIPDKAESADFIMAGIESKEDIPETIKECFDQLMK